MLIGKNGIIRSAGQASETTKDVSEDEQLKLAVADALIYGTGTLTTDNVRQGLISEFGENKVTDTTFTGTGPWTFKGERKTYTIEKSGKITSEGTPTPPTEEKLAKDVLTVSAEGVEDYEKSPYVKYNGILCRVLYNDDKHGLQLVTIEDFNGGDLKEVTLGASGQQWLEAAKSYNGAVDVLNDEAKGYMDGSEVALDARCLGSNPDLSDGKFKGDQTGMIEPNYVFMKNKIRKV